MTFDLIGKTGSYIRDNFKIEGVHVPRPGDLLQLKALNLFEGDWVSTFRVLDVTHVYENGELIPHIRARQVFPSRDDDQEWKRDRLEKLQEYGWLPEGKFQE